MTQYLDAVGGSICNTERAQFATHRMAKYWLKLQHRDGSICNAQRHTNNPLGFWVGTGGWGQWGGVGVRGIRGVRVGDCVHTHSSYVISNPLGFWVGTVGGVDSFSKFSQKSGFQNLFFSCSTFFHIFPIQAVLKKNTENDTNATDFSNFLHANTEATARSFLQFNWSHLSRVPIQTIQEPTMTHDSTFMKIRMQLKLFNSSSNPLKISNLQNVFQVYLGSCNHLLDSMPWDTPRIITCLYIFGRDLY